MIPNFPEFKNLEITDKVHIESMTSKYQPYSDFNFVSMWSWNVNNKIQISKLHNNLILCFTDYVTQKLFYSFLGSDRVDETVQSLIDMSLKNNLSPVLRLMPEVSVENIDRTRFEVVEDIDNFDYIYNVEELRDLRGGKYSKKRNDFNSFIKKFPQAEARVIFLNDPLIVEGIIGLCDKWHGLKTEKGEDFGLCDLNAITRLLDSACNLKLLTVGVFLDNKLVAFFINELLDSDYVCAHMMKADVSIDPGLYTFLIKKSAEILSSHNKKYINYEQDLGIESLRIAKARLRPVYFLKKYLIRDIKNNY